MLKPNIGICIDCGPDSLSKPLIAGRCQTHYWRHRNKLSEDKKKNKVDDRKPRVYNRQPNENTGLSKLEDDNQANSLNLWFNYHIETCKWVCENCGLPIIKSSFKYNICAQAHILPKEHFPSVKLLLNNHLTLGYSDCGCHQRWDHSWERASKMPVFSAAKAKVLAFLHYLSPSEMSRLPEIFLPKLLK